MIVPVNICRYKNMFSIGSNARVRSQISIIWSTINFVWVITLIWGHIDMYVELKFSLTKTQWILFYASCSDNPALLLMVPLHERSDNRSQPGQKLNKKEKWLRNLIKSNLVDSEAWWRAHYEAWSFSNDTTVSRTREKPD